MRFYKTTQFWTTIETIEIIEIGSVDFSRVTWIFVGGSCEGEGLRVFFFNSVLCIELKSLELSVYLKGGKVRVCKLSRQKFMRKLLFANIARICFSETRQLVFHKIRESKFRAKISFPEYFQS